MVAKTATPAAPEAPEVPAVTKKPFSIRVQAPAHIAFNQAVVHARNGYCFSDAPINIQPNGWAFFTMIQGSPNEYAIQSAQESSNLSLQAEERQYQKDVETAAKRIIEQQRREELEQQVKQAAEEYEKQIATLKRTAAAEIAALERATQAELSKLK